MSFLLYVGAGLGVILGVLIIAVIVIGGDVD